MFHLAVKSAVLLASLIAHHRYSTPGLLSIAENAVLRSPHTVESLTNTSVGTSAQQAVRRPLEKASVFEVIADISLTQGRASLHKLVKPIEGTEKQEGQIKDTQHDFERQGNKRNAVKNGVYSGSYAEIPASVPGSSTSGLLRNSQARPTPAPSHAQPAPTLILTLRSAAPPTPTATPESAPPTGQIAHTKHNKGDLGHVSRTFKRLRNFITRSTPHTHPLRQIVACEHARIRIVNTATFHIRVTILAPHPEHHISEVNLSAGPGGGGGGLGMTVESSKPTRKTIWEGRTGTFPLRHSRATWGLVVIEAQRRHLWGEMVDNPDVYETLIEFDELFAGQTYTYEFRNSDLVNGTPDSINLALSTSNEA